MHSSELQAGIRTVVQMADYFEELKQSASQLAHRVTAQTRGYFTPEEEDHTLGLLVSYWQTRNALFELICCMRRDADDPSSPDPVCFLVAFSAATILVDAARWLRETVDHRPIIRDKLNEPALQFGVPEGVYDSIQKSLLSARHGWHLLNAQQYYRDNRDTLREMAAACNASRLMEIIDRLEPRLDVTISRFTQAKLRTRSQQIAKRIAWTVVGQALYGLQKLAGILAAEKYVRLGHSPHLPVDVAESIQRMLLPGDILVCRKEYAFTNYFLPGYWPHAALYLGSQAQLDQLALGEHPHGRQRWSRIQSLAESSPGVVLESMKDGVQLRPLSNPLRSDSIVVLRPQLSAGDVAQGIGRGLGHESKPYDFDFDFRRSDRLVCTEVIYRSFEGLGSVRMPLTQRAGRPTLSGSDLIKFALQKANFLPVVVYAPQLAAELVIGDRAAELIARAQGVEPGAR